MNPLRSMPAGLVRQSLTLSVFDGVLWAVMFGVAENWVVPFALLFGASVFQVSLLQGTALLATGLGQLTGGALIQKGGSRRALARGVVIGHACSWLVIYFGTVWTGSVWFAIGSYCLALFFSNLAGPAWTSWMNDLVPADKRGAYWSFRNSLLGVAQVIPIAVAGMALEQAKVAGVEVFTFGVMFCLGFVARFAGSLCLHFQGEPPMKRTDEGRQMSFVGFLTELRSSNLGRFVLFSVFLNFSIQMIYPIIQVYLLKELNLDYNQYTWTMMTFTIASYVFMLYWGPLSDRFGNRRILMVSALLLPLVAVAWIFAKDWWWLILLQLVSGFMISGINLTTNNFLFDSEKPERMAKTIAYFTALNSTFGFLGAISGGALADVLKSLSWHWGPLGPLTTVFLVIATLRVVVLGAFASKFKEVRDTEPSPGLRYFFIYKPWQDASGWVTTAPVKAAKHVARTLVKAAKSVSKLGRRR